MIRSSRVLLPSLLALLLAASAASADRRCPGGCAATVTFLGGPPMATSMQVDLQIGDFEQVSPTVMRAPVRFNNLDDDAHGIHMRIAGDRPSYFYLESQSPTGVPFFPADSHGDYFFDMTVVSPALTLRNDQPMVVEAHGLTAFPPPPPFTYTLRAATDFTDASGNHVVVQAGSVTIVSDLTTPAPCATPEAVLPRCFLSGSRTGPPASIEITVQDTGSGLAHVEVLESTNATVQVPVFTPGTHDAQVVTATKLDSTQSSRVRLQVADACGNTVSCDPVMTSAVRSAGQPGTDLYTGLPGEESRVTISNGRPGLKSLDLLVNGRRFKVPALADGEETTLDVSSAMRPGNANTIAVESQGRPGGSASILIWDGRSGR